MTLKSQKISFKTLAWALCLLPACAETGFKSQPHSKPEVPAVAPVSPAESDLLKAPQQSAAESVLQSVVPPQCEEVPVIGDVEPEELWHWKGLGEFKVTYSSPVAGDIDGDGHVDIVVVASNARYNGVPAPIVVLDGRTGVEKWNSSQIGVMALASTTPALIDLNGDGKVEIIAVGFSATGKDVIALSHDGKSVLWRTAIDPSCGNFCTVAVADVDGNGKPEIVAGRSVLDHTGKLKSTLSELSHFIPTLVDLDPSKPGLEIVVAGSTVLSSTGELLWKGECGGNIPYSAVSDLNRNGQVELVCVSGGVVRVYDFKGTKKWEAPIPSDRPTAGNGGAPNIGDFTGDGFFEIGVAGGDYYAVFNHKGELVWKNKTQDWSSSATGSTIFDFNGDGRVEVVYNDEVNLYIYDGATGKTLWKVANPSGTLWEYPLVLNIDDTPSVEIVVSAPTLGGLRAFRDPSQKWVESRRLWNQYSYFPEIVTDSLRAALKPGLPKTGFRVNSQGRARTECVQKTKAD